MDFANDVLPGEKGVRCTFSRVALGFMDSYQETALEVVHVDKRGIRLSFTLSAEGSRIKQGFKGWDDTQHEELNEQAKARYLDLAGQLSEMIARQKHPDLAKYAHEFMSVILEDRTNQMYVPLEAPVDPDPSTENS